MNTKKKLYYGSTVLLAIHLAIYSLLKFVILGLHIYMHGFSGKVPIDIIGYILIALAIVVKIVLRKHVEKEQRIIDAIICV